MPSFNKPAGVISTPFGRNQYLHSTKNLQFVKGTIAKGSVTAETLTDNVGGTSQQKILQSGEVIAKITSGPDSGKYGPFQLGVTDGRQTAANIAGLNETFLPWQLMEHDVDASFLYHGTAKQAWCTIRDANGARIVLPDNVRDALRGTAGLDVTFK